MRVLVTGGAGFIGASAAVGLAGRHPDWRLLAVDNLRRRGSELNLARLRAAGVEFQHADVRELDDLLALGEIDALLECSAEPSALAGVDGSADYVVKSNLLGAYHCLELARRHRAYVLFLSTSRVYPVDRLRGLALAETDTRYELAETQSTPGVSVAGITEEFPLGGARTLYGSTKLAAEMLIEEYRAAYGLAAVVDRCGVVAGPWQMGKVDQGVFTHWLLAHHFRRPLQYIGFGGTGKQVRDLLHVEDLIELLDEQLSGSLEVGRGRGQCGRRARIIAVVERDHRAVRRDHGQLSPHRGGVADTGRRCAAIHLRLLAPARDHRMASRTRTAADPVRHPPVDLHPRGVAAGCAVKPPDGDHEANLGAACQ